MARESEGITRAFAAKKLGIGVSRLANYERGAVPIPFNIAYKSWFFLGVNPEWLSEGGAEEKSHEPFYIPEEINAKLQPGALFSTVFDSIIKPSISTSTDFGRILKFADPDKMEGLSVKLVPTAQTVSPSVVMKVFIDRAALFLQICPPQLTSSFLNTLLNAIDRFEAENADALAKTAGILKLPTFQDLTKMALKRKTEGVTWTIQSIREVLRLATSRRGGKSWLAGKLRVSPSRVSEWLRLKKPKEPGGSVALLMRDIADEWQQKQKSPGAVTSSSGAKTRKTKNANRQSPSSRAKR